MNTPEGAAPKKKSGVGIKQTLRDVKAEFQSQAAKKITIHLNNDQAIDLRVKATDSLSDVLTQVGKKKNITLDGSKYSFKRSQDEESPLKNDMTIATLKFVKKELFLVPPLSSLVASKVFGAALVVGSRHSTASQGSKFHYYPRVLEQCFDFLENETHMTEIGIFRLSGSKPEIDKYREMFDSGQDFEFPKTLDPHIVTGLTKLYLRELPEPLMTFDLYDKFLNLFQTCKVKDEDALSPQELETVLQETAGFLSEMPSEHYFVLEYVLRFFKKLLRFQDVNKMTAANLGVVLGPSLFRPRTPTIESMTKHTPILAKMTSFMISQYDVLFEDFASMESSGIPALSPKTAANAPNSPLGGKRVSTRDDFEAAATAATGIAKTKSFSEAMIGGMTDITQMRQILLDKVREKETSDRQHSETVSRLQEQLQEVTRKSQTDIEQLQQQIKEITSSYEEQLGNLKKAIEQQSKLHREESETQRKYFQGEKDKATEEIATLRRQAEQKDLLIRELNEVRKKQLEKATADLNQKQSELVNEYKEKIISLEKELEISLSNLKAIEQSRQKLNDEIAALNNKIKELNEDRERQLKRLEETLEAKITYEKQTTAQLRSKIADLDKDISGLNREKQALSNQLAASKKDLENQKTKSNQQLEAERQTFKQKMLKMEMERTEAERDLRAEIGEKYEQEKQISEKERERIAELTTQLEFSKNEASIAGNMVTMLKGELAEATANNTAIERLKQQLGDKDRQIVELTNSLTSTKKEVEQLKQQLADRDRQIRESSTSSKKDGDQAKKQIEDKDRQIVELTNSLTSTKKEVEQLKQQLADRDRQIRESSTSSKKDGDQAKKQIEDRDRQIVELTNSVTSTKKEVEQLKQQLADRDRQIRESSTSSKKDGDQAKKQLEDSLASAKKEVEQLKQQLADRDRQIRESSTSSKKDGDQAKKQLEDSLASAKKEVEQLKQQLADRDLLSTSTSSLKKETENLQQKEQTSSSSKKELEQAKQQLAEKEKQIRELTSASNSAKKELEHLKQQLEKSRGTNKSKDATAKLEQQIADLTKQNDTLTAQLAELTSRCSNQSERVEELQKRVQELQTPPPPAAHQDSKDKDSSNTRVNQLTGEIRLLRSQISSDQRNFEKQLKEQKDIVAKLQQGASSSGPPNAQVRRLQEQLAQDKKTHEQDIQALRTKYYHQFFMNLKLNGYANFSAADMAEEAINENVSEEEIRSWLAKKTSQPQ